MAGSKRRVVRLVVASTDGTRVLARPNGLAGWSLPVIAVDHALERWDERAGSAAAAIVGAPVAPVRRLAPDAWCVSPTERVPAVGTTWISVDEAGRLGGDAAIVEAWASSGGPPAAPAPAG